MALTRPNSALLNFTDMKSANGGAFADRIKIGTGAAANAQFTNGEPEVLANGAGLLVKAPNATRYRIAVDNAGALSIVAAP